MRSLVLLLVASSAFAAGRNFTLITSSGPIGTLTVAEKGKSYEVKFRVDDNGRGSKLDERIELGAEALPVRVEISGKAWFGAPVKESFTVEKGRARWQSLDGSGEADAKGALYAANDGTPFGIEILLRAARNKPRALLPGGTLRVEKVREVTVGKEKLTAYALWGLALQPAFVLTRNDRMVANLSSAWAVLVEDAHKGDYEALRKLGVELRADALRKLTQKVTHPIDLLWITNVRVFDPVAQKLGAPTNVGVFRDTIVYVGNDAAPADATTVDGGGGTLLPGLFDSHDHFSDWDGPLHMASGVTLGRDPGNDNEIILRLERQVQAGELMGPRLKKSGFLEGKSPFSAHVGFLIETIDEAKAKLRWYAHHGYWGVKIYNSMNPELVKPIAEEAHRLGLHVSGHVPAFMTSERAVRDGYDEINHINQLILSFVIDAAKEDTRTTFRFTALGERTGKLDLMSEPVQRMVKLMKERRTALDPTLATFSPTLLARPGQACPADANWLDHMPMPLQRQRKTATLDVKPEQYPLYDASWKKLEELLLMLHKAGVTLLPGTDDVAGFVLHSELEAWVKAGIPAPAVLSAATIGGAKFLGLEAQLGTIAPGKLADLHLVDGDPTKDITAIRKGRLTLKGGAAWYPDEIHEALGVKPFAARAPLVPPASR